MGDFIVKCITVTLCACFFMYFFYPRITYIDQHHRYDCITGKAEYYSTHFGRWNSL